MADNSVFITGAASGAFADAYAGLPEWATEKTAARIDSVLNKSYNTQNKILVQLMKMAAGGSLDPNKVKQLNKELEDLAKHIKENNREDGKRKRREKERQDAHERDLEDEEKKHKLNAQVAASWTALTSISNKIFGVFKDNVLTFDKLYESGINVTAGFEGVTSGFQALQELSAITGVRYTELSASIIKFNTAINSFSLGRFAKTVGAVSVELRQYGYDTKQAGELVGQYLEIQRGYTDVTAKTQEQVNAEVVTFGKRMTSLSQATGMTRQKLMENIDALSKSVEATILNAQSNSGATQATLDFIGSFQDKNVGQAFLRMMTDSIKPLNTTFQSFQKLGMGGFGQQLMNFTRSLQGLDPKEAARRTAEFYRSNQGAFDSMVRQANMYRQLGLNAEAETVLSMISGMKQQANSYKEVTKEEQETANKSADASKALQSEFENFRAQLQIFMGPLVPLLQGASTLLKMINSVFDGIRTAITAVETFVGDIFGKDLKGTIVPALGSFVVAITGIIGAFILLRTTVTGISTAMAVLKSGILNPKNALSFMMGRDVSGGGRGGPAGGGGGRGGPAGGGGGRGGPAGGGGGLIGGIIDGLSRIGPLIASLGKGFGDAFAGVMRGMATGLAAFANPKILLGAGIFAGAIAIISAGISASIWLVSKSLPSLAEGLKSFDGIDGNALKGVGIGAAALAGGLAAFAATSVLSTAGNALSQLGNGLIKMFGGSSIMDQLKEFAAIGPGLNQAGFGLTVLANGLQTVSEGLKNLTGMDKLKTIVDTVNNLNILKAAALVALGAGGTIVQSSAPSSSVPSAPRTSGTVAPRAAPVAATNTAASTEAPPKIAGQPDMTLINSSIQSQTGVLQELLNSTNNLLSVNKDILKYTKAQV